MNIDKLIITLETIKNLQSKDEIVKTIINHVGKENLSSVLQIYNWHLSNRM